MARTQLQCGYFGALAEGEHRRWTKTAFAGHFFTRTCEKIIIRINGA